MKKAMTFLFLLAALLSTVGCASDDAAQDKDNPTTGATAFTMVDEAPAPQSAKSRTAGEYTGSKVKFYWTENDHLWLNTGADVIESHHSDIGDQLAAGGGTITKVPTATFYFHGTYTDPSYILRYTGKNGTKDKVTIAPIQTQKLPLEATQIGECGDCGIATATKNGDHYDFTLRHKAAYFTLTPFSSDSKLVGGKLTKIKITADKPLAGTFNFGDAGLDIATAPAGPSQSITLNLQGADGKGFTLPAAPNPATNSATFVLPPDTYNMLYFEYSVINTVTHFPGTVTVQYFTPKDFHAGANKKFTPDIKGGVFPVRYLFSDGTTGTFAEKGLRTPIGLVIEEKTATKEGTAMALNNAPTSLYPLPNMYNGHLWDKRTVTTQANNVMFANQPDAINDMDGYKYTWDAAGSADGTTIKANSLDFPAFYVAARYGDYLTASGITVSGSMVGRKWYLPAYGEVMKLRNVFGSTLPLPTEWGGGINTFDPTTIAAIDAAFTQVGAPALSTRVPGYAWTSTEGDTENAVNYYFGPFAADIASGKGVSAYSYFAVTPFVHF